MTESDALAPLPAGVWQLGPEPAARVFELQARLLEVLRGHGYRRVLTPALEPGASTPGAAFRVLDSESGTLLALRSDITPQVARLVATQLAGLAPPHRLCYSGSVFRPVTRHGLAAREIHQAGAELVGASGPEADHEVLSLAAACLTALRLPEPVLVLGHGGLLRALTARLAAELPRFDRPAFHRAALARDLSSARGLVGAHPLGAVVDPMWLGVGPRALVAGLAQVLDGLAADLAAQFRGSLADLGARAGCLEAAGLGVTVRVDLLAERGLDYYTGVSFTGLCRGATRPLLSGGRYDELLARFGRPLPAAGFAVDDEAVLGIIDTAGL